MRVVLNMATSLDGRVAGPGGEPLQLSCEADLARVHRLRAKSDAVAVGIGTVLSDDPRLTARLEGGFEGEQPTRVVVDSRLRTPSKARVLDEAADTIVFAAEEGSLPGAEVLEAEGPEGVDLAQAFDALEQCGLERVLLEGGPTLAASALTAGLVDLVHLYVAPRVLGQGPSLPAALEGLELELEPRSRAPLGEGTLLSYEVPG